MSDPTHPEEEEKDDAYEQKHVHDVYQQIASHFSSTRYKVLPCLFHHVLHVILTKQPWPIVERFLQSQAPGSIGLDIGCGNGKYLTVNRDVFIIASDR